MDMYGSMRDLMERVGKLEADVAALKGAGGVSPDEFTRLRADEAVRVVEMADSGALGAYADAERVRARGGPRATVVEALRARGVDVAAAAAD